MGQSVSDEMEEKSILINSVQSQKYPHKSSPKKVSKIKEILEKLQKDKIKHKSSNAETIHLNLFENGSCNESFDFNKFYNEDNEFQKDDENNDFIETKEKEENSKEKLNLNNPLIENFNNDDKNFLFLKKKIFRKKSNKPKKVDDIYEKFKEDNAIQRRSMRIKLNSLKTNKNHNSKVKKVLKKKAEKEMDDLDKTETYNKMEKKKRPLKENSKHGKKEENDNKNINKENNQSKSFSFSITEMLRRYREGENSSNQFNNENANKKKEDEKEEAIKSNERNNIKNKLLNKDGKSLKRAITLKIDEISNEKNIKKNENSEENGKKLPKEKTNLKKKGKKDKEKINRVELDEAELLLEDMEIPKTNNIIKVQKHIGNHKNPLKFDKKITASEITEKKANKIKIDLLEYLIKKIDFIEIYNNDILKENNSKSKNDIEDEKCIMQNETESKFNIFMLINFDIENIFMQKLDEEITNNIQITEFSLYEKLYFVFDLIFENVERLEIGDVLIFVFSFLKGLITKCKFDSVSEVYELIFGYMTVKINEILSDERLRKKCFLNNLIMKLNMHFKNNAIELLQKVFENIFLNFEDGKVFEQIFIKNQYLNSYYLISFSFAILFYLNFEIFDEKKIAEESNKNILKLNNLDYFRLMQEFLLGINYSDKYLNTSELNINNESNAYETLQNIFELFCLFTEKINMADLHIDEIQYEKSHFNKNNKIMIAENLRDKIFSSNFFYIIRKIFLCDTDQKSYTYSLAQENNSLKEEDLKMIKKQNLILQIFGNLYLSFISNLQLHKCEELTFSFCELNSKFFVLKIVELTQFMELAIKIYKIPLIYQTVFEQVLWPEFTKQGQNDFIRRIILYLIAILYLLVIREDTMFKYDQTKNLMNWLYAIVDPKFDSKE